MNIIAKQDGQATVAKRDPQNWHNGASVEVAAAQFGQLRVSACIPAILSAKTRKEARQYRTGSGPGSPRGQPAWGGGSDRVLDSTWQPDLRSRDRKHEP
jgi:hypothetical protein